MNADEMTQAGRDTAKKALSALNGEAVSIAHCIEWAVDAQLWVYDLDWVAGFYAELMRE